MIERRMGLLGALLVLAQAGMLWGCASSSDSTPSTGGSSATGGASTSTGGATGTATGGATGTATGGAPAGGAGSCPMQTLPIIVAACKGISTGMACTAEGQACPTGLCGVADTGRRDCNCATNWSCTPCNFDNSPFKCPPANLPLCTTEADKVACSTSCSVCDKGTEICACYPDDKGDLIWDCDKKPSTWGTAACP